VKAAGAFASDGKNQVLDMAKDNDGVWTCTVPASTEGKSFEYTFNVDGLSIPDPKCPTNSANHTGVASFAILPGSNTGILEAHDVAHGSVIQSYYKNSATGITRRVTMYLPPDYLKSSSSYPVLYLLHGGGGTDSNWVQSGRANFVLDNGIAAGKIKSMVVVMPDGYVGQNDSSNKMGADADQDLFTADLIKDLIPYVEKNYRVMSGPANRALMGLSMGGAQVLNIAFKYPSLFAYVAPVSTGWFENVVPDVEAAFGKALDSGSLSKLKLFYLGIGSPEDIAYKNMQNVRAKIFDAHKVPYKYEELGYGGHEWFVWSQLLNRVGQLLFR
jgi:Enterochelin esterase and related enzymes